MIAPMSFVVDISYIHFPAKGWRSDVRAIRSILEATAALGVDLRFHTDPDESCRPIASREELANGSAAWQAGSHVLASEPGVDPAWALHLSVLSTKARVLVVMPESAAPGLLDRAVAFVARLDDELGPAALLGCDVALRQTHVEWPRPRPPRAPAAWTIGALVMFASRRYHERPGTDDLHELERLRAAPLPDGATREERGDLTVFRFASSLEADALRAACARQERWLGETLELPRAPGWNAAGDELSLVMSQVPHPPLTYYDAGRQFGYKATVPGDAEFFADAARWLAAGALPDGTPLRALCLIVPDRASALAARAPADRAGIRDVYYVEDGQYWNPF